MELNKVTTRLLTVIMKYDEQNWNILKQSGKLKDMTASNQKNIRISPDLTLKDRQAHARLAKEQDEKQGARGDRDKKQSEKSKVEG